MYTKEEMIRKIESQLGLTFLERPADGNTCFAYENSELRDDFKLSFTPADFENFLRSFQGEEIQIPTDTAEFWKRVKDGASRDAKG